MDKRTCSDWIKEHPQTEEYLHILIDGGKIAPAQADYFIKKIIIDESSKTYNQEEMEVCGFEVWCDLKDIPGYFYRGKK